MNVLTESCIPWVLLDVIGLASLVSTDPNCSSPTRNHKMKEASVTTETQWSTAQNDHMGSP